MSPDGVRNGLLGEGLGEQVFNGAVMLNWADGRGAAKLRGSNGKTGQGVSSYVWHKPFSSSNCSSTQRGGVWQEKLRPPICYWFAIHQ